MATRRRVSGSTALLVPLLAFAVTVGTLMGPVAAGPAPDETQAGANRAAVIVRTGGSSAAVCVRFDEPSISGLTALQRAGFALSTRGFSGEGVAVCGINGTGCPGDGSCLTCQAPNHWAYHRASPGAGGFAKSSVGAGSTQVTDGSVEGWQWGTGAPPPFRTVDDVCGPEAPPPPPPGSGSGGGQGSGGGSGGASSGSGGGSGAQGARPGSPGGPSGDSVAPTTTAPGSTTTTEEKDRSDRGSQGEDEADAPSGDNDVDGDGDLELATTAADAGQDDGGSPVGAITLGVVVLGLLGTAWWVRRRRT